MCKKNLSIDNFKKNKTKKDGLQSQCILCQKLYRHNHYVNNKIKYADKAKIWKSSFKLWWKEYKQQFFCKFCGESESVCIDFHHLEAHLKEDNISKYVVNKSKIKLLEELKKCIPVCANCHRKIHAGILQA